MDLRTCLDLAEISAPNQQSHKDSWYLKAMQSHLSKCAQATINSLRAATSKCNYTASRHSWELWSLQGCTHFGPTVNWEGQHLDSCPTRNGDVQFNIGNLALCVFMLISALQSLIEVSGDVDNTVRGICQVIQFTSRWIRSGGSAEVPSRLCCLHWSDLLCL